MANLGTLGTASACGPGVWMEVTTTGAGAVPNGTSATNHTFTVPTTGNASYLNANYPIGCAILNQVAVQGAANSGLNAALGVSSVTISGSTITVSFVNNSAGSLNVASGTKIVFFQIVGS